MGLRDGIASWDQKTASDIESVYASHADEPGLLSRLIEFMGSPELELGASWMLKHHLEQTGVALESGLATALYSGAGRLSHWGSRLHVLQCMPRVPVPGRSVKAAVGFLDAALADENKFVRAWAYSGYHDLARTHARFRDEVAALLEDALASESAASIRARVRKVIARGFG